ncbi:hypothetical protein A2W24_00915 [Microgenomates group bacterium RBG_16_45_19]|nr:MAG: hypothetical protein A2W24_00915 [Microgenomates group bacterium RBG_16_45_19]
MNEVLVTGLSGMVGSRFKALYGQEYQLTNLDLTQGVDITRPDQVEAAVKQSQAKALIHLAAYTNVKAAFEQQDDKNGPCYQVNVVGSQNVAAACQKYGKYLIHISTDFVFDGNQETAYTESDSPQPIEWYGQTKHWSELAVQERVERWVILRLAYPYQVKPVRPDFLALMIEKIKSGTLPPQFTDHIITPTGVDDIAAIFKICLEKQPPGIYHAVGSSWHSDYDLALRVQETFGLSGEIKAGSLAEYQKTTARPYQKQLKMSNAKLKQELGYQPKTFTEGLSAIAGLTAAPLGDLGMVAGQ